VFSNKRTIGRLYERRAGRLRWIPWRDARGEVRLEAGKEYQLRLSSETYGAAHLAECLAPIDHDLLDEVQIHFRVSRKDYWDQILSGPWLKEVLRERELEIRQHFRTRARLVFRTKVV
jgi:hypothetical protein